MAKATGQKAAAAKKNKLAMTKPVVTKAAAKARKPTAKKPVAKKLVKKVAAKKSVAPPTNVSAKARKLKTPATVVKAAPRKPAERFATVASKKSAPARARRPRGTVLEVSRSIIDTSSAAEVAARLVIEAHGVQPLHPLGNVFAPPSALVVKRESSALRHVKEMLHRPVARQLDGVFGPLPLPADSMGHFLREDKATSNQRVRGGTSVHIGQSNVPHRPVGGGGSRDSA